LKIEELLARRSDLSTFLVHLTRNFEGIPARDRLLNIIKERRLKAVTAYGHGLKEFDKIGDPALRNAVRDTQRVVCFTETPLEHIKLLLDDIDGRQVKFEPYGVAITKRVARRFGVNPVWYLDITPSGHDWLTEPLNTLIKEQIAAGTLLASPLLKLTPYIEQMGTREKTPALTMGSKVMVPAREGYRKEFWWEREWRVNHDLMLGGPLHFIGLCPEEEIPEFEGRTVAQDDWLVEWLDPRWSLERMIAHLAGFPAEDAGIL
jgi:hypothetical protein